ncbi:MAG TPA: hypothetical protein VFP19_05700 [Candidatus Limnocylindrales bacterium]|nr:hypothetical protein [Candidatus Limnocylindrales bacterium]
MPIDRPPLAAPHASHDLLLIAAAADRDADASLRSAAADQVASCVECAALADDLRVLVTGLADLPPAQPTPRDMRLSAAQAARLRRGGLWRRLLRPFGTEGMSGLRPLAATLTTLGLAGILLSALPAGLGFGMGGAAVLNTIGSSVGQGSGAMPAPAASAGGASEQQGTDVKGLASNPAVPAAPIASANYSATGDTLDESGERSSAFAPFRVLDRLPSLSPMAWISIVLVALGVGLLVLRFVAVRLT